MCLLPSPIRWFATLAVVLLAACGGATPTPPPAQGPEPDFVVRESLHAVGTVSRQALAGMTRYQGPDGQPVYLSMPPCCDLFTKLYDADGRFICAPSGGLTGQGDGRCPGWVGRLVRPQPPEPAASNPRRVAETRSGENLRP